MQQDQITSVSPNSTNAALPVRAVSNECLHNWEYGYIADLIIYCTKCKKELDDVYDESQASYRTHDCKDGKLIERK